MLVNKIHCGWKQSLFGLVHSDMKSVMTLVVLKSNIPLKSLGIHLIGRGMCLKGLKLKTRVNGINIIHWKQPQTIVHFGQEYLFILIWPEKKIKSECVQLVKWVRLVNVRNKLDSTKSFLRVNLAPDPWPFLRRALPAALRSLPLSALLHIKLAYTAC